MIKIFGIISIIITGSNLFGQNHDQFLTKSFLIISSTESLDSAYQIAKEAAKKTSIFFKDKKIITNETIGATFPADTCVANGFEFPCYVARGRYDDGTYLSIEYSDAINGFRKGLFIVVAASGNKNQSSVKSALKLVKPYYPSSYVKVSKVYMGCIH